MGKVAISIWKYAFLVYVIVYIFWSDFRETCSFSILSIASTLLILKKNRKTSMRKVAILSLQKQYCNKM